MKKVQNIVLSEMDRIILNSYRYVIKGLADFYGDGFEIILHSLEDLENSVISIMNGHLSGRKIGAPVSDAAISILVKIESDNLEGHMSYDAISKCGVPMRCSTMVIYGENHRAIGLLSINFYMNTPVSNMFPMFKIKTEVESLIRPDSLSSDDVDKTIQIAFEEAYLVVYRNDSILPSQRNKEIIEILFNQGIFNMKDSVQKIANLLGISKNTVYMHIRTIKDN